MYTIHVSFTDADTGCVIRQVKFTREKKDNIARTYYVFPDCTFSSQRYQKLPEQRWDFATLAQKLRAEPEDLFVLLFGCGKLNGALE